MLDCVCGTAIDLMMFLHKGSVSLVNSLCKFISDMEFDKKRQDSQRKIRFSYKNNKNTNVTSKSLLAVSTHDWNSCVPSLDDDLVML